VHLSVKDVLASHSQVLYTNLPPSDLINNLHIKFNATIEDAFIWESNKNGTYTTKSGYNYLLCHNDNPSLTSSLLVLDLEAQVTCEDHLFLLVSLSPFGSYFILTQSSEDEHFLSLYSMWPQSRDFSSLCSGLYLL
jgi:hypothetical protein